MGTLFFPNPYSAHRSIMTEGTKCLVLLGPSATGKSTLAGRIIHQFGGIELNTMETLQARGIAKYDELYRMIACSNVDPHFYLPPRQRVRFVQGCQYRLSGFSCLQFCKKPHQSHPTLQSS